MNHFIKNCILFRRPYFNPLEISRSALLIEQQAQSCGYLCDIDAIIEQISFWFPGIILKRPKEDYGIQLELDLPNWDSSASFPPCYTPSGVEKWNDYSEEEFYELAEEDKDLPF